MPVVTSTIAAGQTTENFQSPTENFPVSILPQTHSRSNKTAGIFIMNRNFLILTQTFKINKNLMTHNIKRITTPDKISPK